MDALIEAEIAEPTRSRLADLDGLTPQIVARVAQQTRSQGGGTGAVVQNIRTAVAASVKRRARAAERARAEAEAAKVERERREAEAADVATGEDRKRLLAEAFGRIK